MIKSVLKISIIAILVGLLSFGFGLYITRDVVFDVQTQKT